MFLSCSSCLVLEGWSNAVFLNISIWQSVYFYISCIFLVFHVFCFLRIVYIVSFFLQAFFNEFVIHGLSGLLFFTVSCVHDTVELYKFVNKLINLLYVMLTSSSLTISSQLHFSKSFMKALFLSSLTSLFFMYVLCFASWCIYSVTTYIGRWSLMSFIIKPLCLWEHKSVVKNIIY